MIFDGLLKGLWTGLGSDPAKKKKKNENENAYCVTVIFSRPIIVHFSKTWK